MIDTATATELAEALAAELRAVGKVGLADAVEAAVTSRLERTLVSDTLTLTYEPGRGMVMAAAINRERRQIEAALDGLVENPVRVSAEIKP